MTAKDCKYHLKRWDSVNAYVQEAAAYAPTVSRGAGSGRDWDKGIGGKRACELAIQGDPSVVPGVTRIVDKLTAGIGQVARMANVLDFGGTRVSVPDYLAGAPKCMGQRKRVSRTARHVSIYVGIVCSAGISADEMLDRGTTILALLEALQAQQVGVDLHLFTEFGQGWGGGEPDLFYAIQVESKPLDISQAGFAIAHPAFARNVTYAHAQATSCYRGSWANARDYGDYHAHLRNVLGANDTDIIIPGPHLLDKAMLGDNAHTWIEQKLVQVGESAL